MAIISLARQVAAHGDEVAAILADKLNYTFIKRTDIEKRIVELGFPESKLPKFDERKPGFFDSMTKIRDQYFNYSQYAMLEAAVKNNVILIGRGAFYLMRDISSNVSVRLVADEKTRVKRLCDEFNWTEKQALQRIQESDSNRDGFHKSFYTVDVADPSNFNFVVNTGLCSEAASADIIADFVKKNVASAQEAEGLIQLQNKLKIQKIVNKLLFENKLDIEFFHGEIKEKTVYIYGIAKSVVVVEQALDVFKKEMPDYEAVSAVTVTTDFRY